MGNKCSVPGQAGFECEHKVSNFSATSDGIALKDATAIIEPDPDIAGVGIFIAFAAAFFFSNILAFIIHSCEWSEIHKRNNDLQHQSKRKKHPSLKKGHHVLDRILVGWSDQQLILGLATSIAVLRHWCSFSTYHLNLIKQWLAFCSITHINALLVHCGYFDDNHTKANCLRIALIFVYNILATIVYFFNGQDREQWSPNVASYTPLQALPAPCFLENATRFNNLEEVPGWGDSTVNGDLIPKVFGFWTAAVLFAMVPVVIGLVHEPARNWKERAPWASWISWGVRLVTLLVNLGFGCLIFYDTLELRKYMINKGWVRDGPDDSENEFSYGQYVSILLAVLVLFSAFQTMEDETPDRKSQKNRSPTGIRASRDDSVELL